MRSIWWPARVQRSGCLCACRSTCPMTEGRRPILMLLLLVAGLWCCCCRVNVKLFSHVTLIRKLQMTSDLDHFHPHASPCSRVKSRDDPIRGRRGDSEVLYCFIYTDQNPLIQPLQLYKEKRWWYAAIILEPCSIFGEDKAKHFKFGALVSTSLRIRLLPRRAFVVMWTINHKQVIGVKW